MFAHGTVCLPHLPVLFVRRPSLLSDQHYAWWDDHNCWSSPKPPGFITVVCRRSILRGQVVLLGGRR
jgi:hypothetical protein